MWIVRQPIPGCLHHVISRFIDRDFLITDDRAREHYLRLLARAMADSDWRCFAYALMSNHIHLAMLAGNTAAERWTRRVHPPFAAALNSALERIGPAFADTQMWVVRPENELRTIAYIHNNPVRAGLVAHARESTWTSHRAFLGMKDVPWLATAEALQRVGCDAASFDAAVDAEVGYKPDHRAIDGVRRSARRHGAMEVGTPTSGNEIQAPIVARPWAHLRPTPTRLLEMVAEVTGWPVELQRARGGVSTRARAVAMQSGRTLGLSLASVAAALGISAQAGSRLALRKLAASDRAAMEVVSARLRAELDEFIRVSALEQVRLRKEKESYAK